LDFCQSSQEGQATILARVAFSSPPEAGTRSRGDSGERGMAYTATHIRHLNEGEWRGHQDDPGAFTPFELQGDCRHLHTGRHSYEARSANQACQNDSRAGQVGGGRTSVSGVTFSYRTLSNPRRKGPIRISLFNCWRPKNCSFELFASCYATAGIPASFQQRVSFEDNKDRDQEKPLN
jgi:hypothetical protein